MTGRGVPASSTIVSLNEQEVLSEEETKKQIQLIIILFYFKHFINLTNSIMRKHFLLLMLLTLLPLAGWAEEVFSPEKTVVAVSRIEYQQATMPTIKVTHDGGTALDPKTEYTIDGVFAKNDGTGSALEVEDLQVGQTYYVKVTGKGVYAGSAYGAFTVEKATLKVTISGGFVQNYKTGTAYALKADHSDVTVEWEGHTIADINDYLVFGADYDYSPKYTANTNEGTYAIKFSGLKAKDENNFELKIADASLVVNKQNLSTIYAATNLYATRTNYDPAAGKQFTYTATAQKPTYTVAWDHDGDGKKYIDLTENTDFTVKYFVGSDEVDAANVVNAATYGIKLVGNGNYEGTVDLTDKDDYKFIINKAPLTIMALPQTKNYDGAAFDLAGAKFSITGRQGNDASLKVNGLVASGTMGANVGVYSVDVTTTSATIGTGTPISLGTNYDISTVAVNWTITPRPVTLTVPEVKMTKGADFPMLNTAPYVLAATAIELNDPIGTTGAINSTDQTALAACYELKYLNGKGEPLNGVTAGASGNIETKQYANAIDATKKASLTSAQETLLANYEVTVVKGTLNVSGSDFEIMPIVESDVEYGDNYTIGYYASGATIDESKLVFVINGTEYPYAAQVANLPTARGNYTVTIKEGSAVGKGNYLNGKATLSSTAFSIVKKKLTVVVKDQTVFLNDVAADFLAGLAADNSNVTVTGVKEGETLKFEYSLDASIAVTDGKITSVKGDYPGVIKIAFAEDDVNENYEIPAGYTKGKLTISDEYKVDLAAATATKTIQEAGGNGNKYDVTISGRTLTANTWNVMVLPFAVNTLDFCNAIGSYAIFNTLQKVEKDASDPTHLKDKIYFQIELNEIPANQPFLVKPRIAVDFDADKDKDKVKDIVIKNVKFVNAEPVQTNVDGVKFIGTYEAAADINSTDWWGMQGGNFKHFTQDKIGGLKFTRAYIQLTDGATAAEFFVEDIDNNGFTAIKSLNTDTMQSVALDGWYTLNGIKLQGAPTEKGVYINNGKKVVLK